jgi:hypothetical protein
LLNGELISTISVRDTTETQSAPVFIDGQKKVVRLNFRDAEVKKWDSDKILPVKIIDSHLNSKYPRLSSYEQKALYINFIMRHPKLIEGSKEFSIALKSDPYSNALQVKFGYALTCHKAQGGEWEKIFVDFKGRVGLKEAHLRWSYTAITRAVQELMVVNFPNIKTINQIQYSEISPLGNLPANAVRYSHVQNTPFHDQTSPLCQRAKFYAIENQLLDTRYSIKQVITRSPYHETYAVEFLSNDDQECIVTIELNNNAAGVYSSYRTKIQSKEGEEVIDLMKKSIPDNYYDQLNSQEPHLLRLHSKILSCMDEKSIRICGIDETRLGNYFISYYFEFDGVYRMIQFYFNKKRHFTRALTKSNQGPNDQIFQEFIDRLKR